MLAEGSPAPDFTLKGSDGREHSLSEFRGRSVILYFYPKDDTPGCTIEAKEFNSSIGELEKKYSLKFLLLSDPESRVIKLYGAYGERGIFGPGTLRKTFVIDEKGKISKIFEKVAPRGHCSEVLSAL
jgi:peroxiredoxin Q/BCP